jgi:putative membrane-bound dehydrogenase-like protein
MRNIATDFRAAVLSILITMMIVPVTSGVVRGDDVVHLFDGESLNGWEADPQHWRVENQTIVGEIPAGQKLNHNTWLVWRGGELRDFDLQLQVKLSGLPAANSGIQFRCQVEDVNHVSGYQADLDMGATWLGRIYDEHGRALLVERGSRVFIAADGKRTTETFAPANEYAVLFRENEWNDYRIVAVGDHVKVFINGTLFSELQDQQTGAQDLRGSLAFQLHAGPETRVEFRDVRLEHLNGDDTRLGRFQMKPQQKSDADDEPGLTPTGLDGKQLNLDFETGDLSGWTATGDAFDGQPLRDDGIAGRWPGQISNKNGNFFIAGYERMKDQGVGTLTSSPFRVTHPWASLLIGGGEPATTRVEIVQVASDGDASAVLFTVRGDNHEQMRRVAIDLAKHRDKIIAVRLVDENSGAWGHLNFDDFRFHDSQPVFAEVVTEWRSTANPLLQHLVANTNGNANGEHGEQTLAQMFVPKGFSVDVIAAEPHLHQPMAFTFDAKGRLWVVEGHSYPQKRLPGEGLDRILIFSDDDNDGNFETRKVFIEGLNLVSGLEVGFGGVWVGAAPELLFIPDRDGDDVPDAEPQVLLNGFGFADTHETMNSFMWGPDGWLYGNQGVFNSSSIGKPGESDDHRTTLSAGVWRYHPTRRVFEVFAHGGSNQWGLDYDDFGQIFMTHCRSRWGEGLTTHVQQGGHYWNQINGRYASFVSSTAPRQLPMMRNFLKASARYGHGEGGAGKRGSRAVYGGHSHVGTMIYLGDNWPVGYRNHLFTHNLHGHQMNHQVNNREAGGYDTVHAGFDMLFCADRQYIGVDLQYGPDGAVYISDWYDPRHCHNPDVEQWDRGNGRMYRMKYDATWQPATVDYTVASDADLIAAQSHPNEWHVRMSRLVLAERSTKRAISAAAVDTLVKLATLHSDPARRLRAVWTLHSIGQLQASLLETLMDDESEYIRSWAVQLAVEQFDERLAHPSANPPQDNSRITDAIVKLASSDRSLFVRRYLASAIPRVPREVGWQLSETLSRQSENAADRNLPQLLWYGLATLMPHDLNHALQLADDTRLPALRNWIHWYAARRSNQGRAAVVAMIATAESSHRSQLVSLLEFGVRGMRGVAAPDEWNDISGSLYAASDPATRQAAESIGAAFGDDELYRRMRVVLATDKSGVPVIRHALSILASDTSTENLPLVLSLLDRTDLAAQALPMLSRYDDESIARAVLDRLPAWKGAEYSAAMELLSGRVGWSELLLDQIAEEAVDKSQLSAYYARKMVNLGSETLNARLAAEWGALGQSTKQRRREISKFVAEFQSAPLWAYSANSGSAHFKKLCASCHEPTPQNAAIAPRLAGSGSKGVAYIAENVLDPNAVIGRDFQARIIVTISGLVISGLVESETDSAITVRTLTGSTTVAKDEIDEILVSKNSFMPESLLKTLNDRERIELFKYLTTL